MKVKDIINKVNYGCAKLPVYLADGVDGKMRKVESFDYANYYYDEKDATVMSITLDTDKIIIHYKGRD